MTPTLNSCWDARLKTALSRLAKIDRPVRSALLGVGNELRGDDAAGVLLARGLQERLGIRPETLVLDAGGAPENFTGPLRRFAPDLVILVDAAQMNGRSGEIRWIEMDEVEGVSSSTHTLPMPVIAAYLSGELGCQVALLGIQPVQIGLDDPLSTEVASAIDEMITKLLEIFKTISLEHD